MPVSALKRGIWTMCSITGFNFGSAPWSGQAVGLDGPFQMELFRSVPFRSLLNQCL